MSLVLINIPVFFGIIDVNYEQKDLYLTYKLAEAKSIGFKGLYDNPHNFSIYNSLSYLIILNNLVHKKYKSIRWFQFLVLLIAVYFSYLSFVRTGWVIIIVGSIYVYFKYFKNVTKLKKIALVLLIPMVFVLVYFQVSQSKLILMRLLDQTAYNKNAGFETQGAGRLLFSYQALINWLNDGFLSIIFGYGLEKGKLLLYKTIGYNLVSHNGIVDILQSTGFLGFGVFSLYIKNMFFKASKYFSDIKTKDDFILILITFLFAGVLQSFTYPYILFLLGLSFYNASYNSIRT
ncbi:O-antigen ligase family protein [Winogradskyella sp.]